MKLNGNEGTMDNTIAMDSICNPFKGDRKSCSDSMDGKSPKNTGPFPLRLAREGNQVRIVSMKEGKGFRERLAGMGLLVGAQMLVIQNHMDGNLLIDHDGTRLFLGGGMANKIQVVVTNEGGGQ
jgi:ferrous iron transport protein A